MRLSVIVPRTDHGQLDALLDALARQTAPRADWEAVLVDSAAAAKPAGMQHMTPNVGALSVARHGRAALLNAGLAATSAPLVLLLADDFLPSPELFARHLALHDRRPDPRVCAVAPAYFAPAGSVTPFQRWLEDSGRLFGVSFTQPPSAAVRARFWYAGNTSLKRKLLTAAGPFSEAFPTDAWDDFEMGLRLFDRGMEVEWLLDAHADHVHPVTLDERRHAMRRAGEAAFVFERLRGQPHPLRALCDRSPLRLWLADRRARARWLVSRRDAHREAWFERTLERWFAAGYRQARRAHRETRARSHAVARSDGDTVHTASK